jgi:two-component system cell cycle response regulator DivK
MDAATKTILIVEDNVLNMKLFNDLIKSQGYQVLQANEGANVLNIVRGHRPDLIIMDVQLPDISGIDLTKQLKEDESLRMIPVLAVTAFAMQGDEALILESGCEGYITKPICLTKFLETIHGLLR